MPMPRLARNVALASLAAVLCACGGGGGGGPGAPTLGEATFTGTYFAVLKAGGTAGGADARGTTGILTADGAGNASHTYMTNDSGSVSGPDTLEYLYTVAGDGTVDVASGSFLVASGGISADGRCALLGSAAPGAFPGLLALVRREGLHGLETLTGPYHFVELVFSPFASSTISVFGDIVFDGAGAGTATLSLNGMGTVLTGGPAPVTYTVIGDGTSTLAFDVPLLEGGVFAGGDGAIWAGSTTDSAAPAVAVAVKSATSAGLSTLQGSYWIVCLSRDPVSDEFRSLHGTATADGAGNLTLLVTANTEGVITTEPPQSTTYTVSPSGKLTVDAGGALLAGGITQDGRFAAIGGGTTAGSDPTICLLCRK